MVQVEIIEASNEQDFVNDINYFLEQLDDHLLIDIKYNYQSLRNNTNFSSKYSALIIYRVQ